MHTIKIILFNSVLFMVCTAYTQDGLGTRKSHELGPRELLDAAKMSEELIRMDDWAVEFVSINAELEAAKSGEVVDIDALAQRTRAFKQKVSASADHTESLTAPVVRDEPSRAELTSSLGSIESVDQAVPETPSSLTSSLNKKKRAVDLFFASLFGK